MRAYLFLCVLLTGCGASVAPLDPEVDSGSAVADTGVRGFADTSSGAFTDASGPIATDAGPKPALDATAATFSVTRLRVCGSSDTVDKAIIDTSERIAPVADATKFIRISYVGASSLLCPEIWDAKSSSGDYAFGARCSKIDRSREIEFVINEGIYSASGKALAPGVYKFVPGGMGPECAEYTP